MSNVIKAPQAQAHRFQRFSLSDVQAEAREIIARARSEADAIGVESIVLERNEKDLVPFPPDTGSILIIGPQNLWELYPTLTGLLAESGYAYDLVEYSSPWNGPVRQQDYLASLPVQAAQYDHVLLVLRGYFSIHSFSQLGVWKNMESWMTTEPSGP